MLRRIGVETSEVRLPEQLEDLDGLIIPAANRPPSASWRSPIDLMEPLRQFGAQHADLGHLRRGDLSLDRCPPPAAAAGSDGYQRRAQCLWTAGSQLRDRPGDPCLAEGRSAGRAIPCRLHPRPVDRIGRGRRAGAGAGCRMAGSWLPSRVICWPPLSTRS